MTKHSRPSSKLQGSRRGFLKVTAAASAAIAVEPILGGTAFGQVSDSRVAIVFDNSDPLVRQVPVRWAAEQLRNSFTGHELRARFYETLEEAPANVEIVLIAGKSSLRAMKLLSASGLAMEETPEALCLMRGSVEGRGVLLACGADERGLVYALLELADRFSCSNDPITELLSVQALSEKPANRIRSVARAFVSDVEDKPWFYDKGFWREYLTMLAEQRFNRFSLTLGIGYDFTTDIRDCYFHFPYPFFLDVPGYGVKAKPLPEKEREKNLEMLKFIGEETARRGLHFQLGLWTHAYEWIRSPDANYVIEGLTSENHADYCRDALRQLLEDCPQIGGVTFRVHGESGVAEGSYDFWKTVFNGVIECGRTVEIDLHAKGIDAELIDIALATGMPVTVSPKYWAEHMGLSYMQADIRPNEMVNDAKEASDNGFFARSSGSRKFLRYGYGDLLTEDRKYGILHRMWPGTQRLLLWGDPVTAAGYGRASGFCGSDGMELFEPLFFKGRKGSGLPNGRDGYAERTLHTRGGWEKFEYSYRLWGRLAYNPKTEPETWRRSLRMNFGGIGEAVGAALASASRILPLVTTAHCPSAANNNYWPEMYANMPIVDPRRPHPYYDTPEPKRFGAVSPLDPELFSRVDDFAGELLEGRRSGKYSPVDVAQRLRDLATSARRRIAQAESQIARKMSPEWRRWSLDIAMLTGIGDFFAWKFRAGVLYAIYRRSGYRQALEEAVRSYHSARAAWSAMAEAARGVYLPDITFGRDSQMRGHWLDRLGAIDADIDDMESQLRGEAAAVTLDAKYEEEILKNVVQAVLTRPKRPTRSVEHKTPARYSPGTAMMIEIKASEQTGPQEPFSVRLHYRHVNQAERWQSVAMEMEGTKYFYEIPAEYTDSPYPLQYYFELRDGANAAWLYPGFSIGFSNQPYYVVRRAT